ncbi:hypothetical protein GLOIN_2v1790242 [Rhizophagus irregularis DAOM 181602=DAOM 197198]|nr:hypothetical protein GLOIN_2v1790242 [Rhizophagus irregularis DAOM 181602=DAOM 197198]
MDNEEIVKKYLKNIKNKKLVEIILEYRDIFENSMAETREFGKNGNGYDDNNEIRKQNEKLLENKKIRLFKEEVSYVNYIVVSKKRGQLQICHNFLRKYVIALNLVNGYFYMKMKNELSEKLYAFITKEKAFTPMFGIKNASKVFNNIIYRILPDW